MLHLHGRLVSNVPPVPMIRTEMFRRHVSNAAVVSTPDQGHMEVLVALRVRQVRTTTMWQKVPVEGQQQPVSNVLGGSIRMKQGVQSVLYAKLVGSNLENDPHRASCAELVGI